MAKGSFRREKLTRPIFRWAQKAMPSISETESKAIDAGTVWWDGELFGGSPDWEKLVAMPPAELSAEERAFMDGPVEQLCAMVDDWKITSVDHDLPPEVWDFLRREKFFGMIIPKEYGGLGFSNTAHSEVVRKVSSVSVVAGVTVMVPNSLGPGELMLHFGTEEQKNHWLPRLADGREIPCFGLTSPDAGSDAASMRDTGVVEYGEHEGREVLGIRLNFDKRYITLGPVATVMGLAFKMQDPQNHLGRGENLGITVALLPTATRGVTYGERHVPLATHFQNGPLHGRDVFIPMDWILGGQAQIGEGWTMLMTALAAGRSISLPSQSAAACAMSARASGAYARVRHQFGLPIGKFEGIQEPLAEIAANAYQVDAARRLTLAALDQGHRPSVISAIMKANATERMRQSVNLAMDIHGGKGIVEGPRNYMAPQYRSIPIGITVEGANILTRSLMIFGQGAIRAHPYMLKEMKALSDPDKEAGLDAFDRHFWGHVGHAFRNAGRAFLRGWTGGIAAPAPDNAELTGHWRQLSRLSSAFALTADMALLSLGGALKRKEMLSGRLGDILSELYLLAACLKRFETEGRPEADKPLIEYVMRRGINRIGEAFDGIIANLPSRSAAFVIRAIAFPAGAPRAAMRDDLVSEVAELLMRPTSQRDRLTADLYLGAGRESYAIAELEEALDLVTKAEPAMRKMKEARMKDADAALEQALITTQEHELLMQARAATERVVAVDAYPAEEVSHLARRNADAARAEAAE